MNQRKDSLPISEVIDKLVWLRDRRGDIPVYLIEPVNGEMLPLSKEKIEDHRDHVEIWPID